LTLRLRWVFVSFIQTMSTFKQLTIARISLCLPNGLSSSVLDKLLAKVLSQESIDAVKIIRSILSDVHTEHGVVDVFGKYKTYDVLASILALSRLQSVVIAQEQSLRKDWIEIASGDSQSRDLSDANADLLQELAHYSVYAQAAYGWPMDLALRRRLHWGGNCQALVRITGIAQNDIVKAEWKARAPHRPAYFIVRDHSRHSIVLCVRGTWSAHDLLTDLRCTAQYFDVEGFVGSSGSDTNPNFWNIFSIADQFLLRLFDRKRRGHHGMLEAARAVLSDTETIIQKEMNEHPGYSLVCVGHSLGGGCAALIGTLLECRYTDLKVYIFGAPCVVPENSRLHPNIFSVVLDGDPFSCLSLGHIADVSTGLARLCEDPLLRSEILLRTNTMGTSMSEADISWCCNAMNMLRRLMTAEKLFPPGRILLLKPGKKSSNRRRRHWWWPRPKRSANRDVEGSKFYQVSTHNFRDLVIGARMIDLSRHLPSLYVSTLEEIAALQKDS
jgi:Lipase (class 3)